MNLISDPWVPVVDSGMKSVTVSLRDLLFSKKGTYISIAKDANPLVVPSLIRFLVALVTDALSLYGDDWMKIESDEQWDRLLSVVQENGIPRLPLEKYFQEYHDRFEMNGPTPFMQCPGLTEEDGSWTINHLDMTKASGENTGVFHDSSYDGDPQPRTLAECAVLLIACQATVVKSVANSQQAAKWGKTVYGPVGRGSFTVIVVGRDIPETIALNMISHGRADPFLPRPKDHVEDVPSWRRAPLPSSGKVSDRPITGICDFLSFQVRRVLLKVDKDGLVRSMMVRAGGILPKEALDPYAIYNSDGRTLKYEPQKDILRDLPSILATRKDIGENSKKEGLDGGEKPVLSPPTILQLKAVDTSEVAKIVPIRVFALKSNSSQPLQFCDSMLSLPIEVLRDEEHKELLGQAERIAEDAAQKLKEALTVLVCESSLWKKSNKTPHSMVSNGTLKYWSVVIRDFERMFILGKPSEETIAEFRAKCVKESIGVLTDVSIGTSMISPRAFVDSHMIVSSMFEKERLVMHEDLVSALFGKLQNDEFGTGELLSRIRRGGVEKAMESELLAAVGHLICDNEGRKKVWSWRCVALCSLAYALATNAKKVVGKGNEKSFGSSMYDAKRAGHSSERRDQSFDCILSCNREEFFPLMETAIRFCVTSGAYLDPRSLLKDVMEWNRYDRKVQREWSWDYYSKKPVK